MAKLTKDEIIKKVNELFGEDATDEQLSLLEDISDSFEGSGTSELDKTKEELEKAKNDLKEYRQKYRERFLSGEGNEPSQKDKEDEENEDKTEEDKKLSYSDLFTSEQ